METFPRLREQARALEQAEQHARALDLYRTMAESAPDGLAAAGVYHHLGELHARLGEHGAAVAAYARALELYRDASLANVALALAGRIVRLAPDRLDAYLTIGRLAAGLGYGMDARAAFVEYAARAGQAGDADGALQALREAAGLLPDDPEVRRMLRERLPGGGAPEPPLPPPPEPEVGIGLLSNQPDAFGEALPAPHAWDALDPSRPPDDAHAIAPLEGLEPTRLDEQAPEPRANADALPLLGYQLDAASGAPAAREEGDTEPLPLLAPAEPGPEPPAAGPSGRQSAHDLEPGDAATHYDLGLAFKEMGLLDDAVAHFQTALRGGGRPLPILEVLGECYVEKGEPALAARLLERAAELPGAGAGELVGVLYWLARAAEALGRRDQARGHYERVIAGTPGFRDAALRLHALHTEPGDPAL